MTAAPAMAARPISGCRSFRPIFRARAASSAIAPSTALLADEISGGVHALALEIKAPGE